MIVTSLSHNIREAAASILNEIGGSDGTARDSALMRRARHVASGVGSLTTDEAVLPITNVVAAFGPHAQLVMLPSCSWRIGSFADDGVASSILTIGDGAAEVYVCLVSDTAQIASHLVSETLGQVGFSEARVVLTFWPRALKHGALNVCCHADSSRDGKAHNVEEAHGVWRIDGQVIEVRER
jgi:hypothetical protein